MSAVDPPLPRDPLRAAAPGRLRLRTLVAIRWAAVLGQAVAVLVVELGLGFELPLAPVATTIFAAAVANVILAVTRPAQARLGDRQGALYLAFDILQLALLLFLTGGVQNPFALLLLAPVAIAAATLSGASTVALSALTLLAIGILGRYHLRLPWFGEGIEFPPVYQFGQMVGLAVATLLIAAYAWSLSNAQRRMLDAMAATQAALAREQRLAALGGLAAAAAHELGSPLSTIAVVAQELKRVVPADSPLADDITLLVSQSRRCSDILARLAERPEQSGGAPFERLPASALVAAAGDAMADTRPGVETRYLAEAADGSTEPVLARAPEILHALGNLIENARQFASRTVKVTTAWSGATSWYILRKDDLAARLISGPSPT